MAAPPGAACVDDHPDPPAEDGNGEGLYVVFDWVCAGLSWCNPFKAAPTAVDDQTRRLCAPDTPVSVEPSLQLVSVSGALAAGALFIAGWLLFRRFRRAQKPPDTTDGAAPEGDESV